MATPKEQQLAHLAATLYEWKRVAAQNASALDKRLAAIRSAQNHIATVDDLQIERLSAPLVLQAYPDGEYFAPSSDTMRRPRAKKRKSREADEIDTEAQVPDRGWPDEIKFHIYVTGIECIVFHPTERTWVQLACPICGGNTTTSHYNPQPRFLNGVKGVYDHMKRYHRDQNEAIPKTPDAVLEACRVRTFTKEVLEGAVNKGLVEMVLVRKDMSTAAGAEIEAVTCESEVQPSKMRRMGDLDMEPEVEVGEEQGLDEGQDQAMDLSGSFVLRPKMEQGQDEGQKQEDGQEIGGDISM